MHRPNAGGVWGAFPLHTVCAGASPQSGQVSEGSWVPRHYGIGGSAED
jgi:hypothetical protein